MYALCRGMYFLEFRFPLNEKLILQLIVPHISFIVFKIKKCNKVLSLGNYAALRGKFFW